MRTVNANDLVLYTYWRSSSAYRVRLGLALKGLAYRSVFVNLLKGEQRSEGHIARSPLGFVPCLEVGGKTFIESVAILELLDELYPERPLLPREPFARARVRALVEIINAGTQPLQNLGVLQHLSPDPEVRKGWTRHWIARGLAAFEAQMVQNEADGSKGRFAFGDAPTMADCYLLPMVYNARRYHVDMAPIPRIAAACDAFAATEAAKSAAPEAQPDAVPDAK
jgi:maleylacetoacetate isomerase